MRTLLFLALLFYPQTGGDRFAGETLRIDRERGLRVFLTRARDCLQLDGKVLPCPTGPVRYFVSHWDHGHVPFAPRAHVLCFDGAKPPWRFQAWRKLPRCPPEPGLRLVGSGAADWDGNSASRVFFLTGKRLLVLADLPPGKLPALAGVFKHLRPDWVLLPRTNAFGKKEARLLRGIAPRFGFISSAPRTRAFTGRIYLEAADWGNLVFAE